MPADDRDLIIRALDENLAPEEAQRLRQLLDTSAAAQAEWDRHQSVRGLVADHGASSFAPDFADRVMDELPASSRPPTRRRPDRTPRLASVRSARWARIGGAVLAVVVLIGLSAVLGLWTQTVAVPYGERTTVSLPDGSTVDLSAGSTLRHAPFWWPGPREVTLDGEAFFAVADGGGAFIVETFNARVVVTGTRFNVRAWRDDPTRRTTVALTEGRVDVTPSRSDTAAPVILRPGETSVVGADTTVTVSAAERPLDRALAWRSGGLAFVDQPLASALRELERRYALAITLADPALADTPLTYLNPQPTSAEAALTDICHVLGLRFRRTADGFTVLRQ